MNHLIQLASAGSSTGMPTPASSAAVAGPGSRKVFGPDNLSRLQLQSGSDPVLARTRRDYTVAEYLARHASLTGELVGSARSAP